MPVSMLRVLNHSVYRKLAFWPDVSWRNLVQIPAYTSTKQTVIVRSFLQSLQANGGIEF
jgi:hypothetical protein